MDNHFGGIIWTNHAIERMRERGIKQGDAWATWSRPEQSYKANLHKGEDAWRYYRTYGSERIEVVARQNEKHEWVIISVWSDPVFQKTTTSGTKVGLWKNLFRIFFGK